MLKKVLDSLLVASNVYTLVKILDFIQKIVTEISRQSSEQDLLKLIDPVFHFYYNYYYQYYKVESSVNSAKIIFTSLMNLIRQYCSLDSYKVVREQPKTGFFGSVFSWKKKAVIQMDYPIIEKFMVDNLQKIATLVILGWEMQGQNKEQFAFNIGIMPPISMEKQVKVSKKLIQNEDFLETVEKLFHKYRAHFFNIICELWAKQFQQENQKGIV